METQNIFEPFNRFAPDPIFMDPIDVDPNAYPLPPVYQDPGGGIIPVKDPIYNGGGVIINPPALRGYVYSGTVRDAYSEQPLPGATVSIMRGGQVVARIAADGSGNFSVSVDEFPADQITITEVAHKSFSWPASESQHTFDLEPGPVTLPPVLLPPGSKANYTWLLWLGGGLLVAKSQKWI